ncbi:hypothetical protein scyTo_0024715, partial [Scyliorhinus torazame]|nr:hypothetical protein [Scyliorhinus torazame]
MLVNIQQPLLKTESAMLLAAENKAETCQGDLSTLANVVTSLAHLSKSKDLSQSSADLSGIDALSNGDASLSEMQQDDQSASDIT